MRSKDCLLLIFALLCSCFVFSTSQAVDIAKVGDDTITSDEYIDRYNAIAPTQGAPAWTPEGKREFLDRLIAKHLLSQFFHSIGWDTLAVWDSIVLEYGRGQYLQGLYFSAIPEVRTPAPLVSQTRLMELGKAFVDSLQNAYNLKVDEKAVMLMADKSGVQKMPKAGEEEGPAVAWPALFTDEEKRMTAATFLGGKLTLGEIVKDIEELPPFAKPTPGNSDEIAVTIEHFGREAVFAHEFDKRKLSDSTWYKQKLTNKKEELMLGHAFANLRDTCTVTEDEVKKYYDEHRDEFVTVTRIKLSMMRFASEDVAQKAAKKIAGGESFEDAAVDLSVYSMSETGYDTTDFIDKSQHPALYDALWDKKIGEVAGPVPEQEIWVVAKLLDRTNPRLLTLEEATPMIAQKMRLAKADQALTKLIQRLKSQTKIVIDEKALAALELPK